MCTYWKPQSNRQSKPSMLLSPNVGNAQVCIQSIHFTTYVMCIIMIIITMTTKNATTFFPTTSSTPPPNTVAEMMHSFICTINAHYFWLKTLTCSPSCAYHEIHSLPKTKDNEVMLGALLLHKWISISVSSSYICAVPRFFVRSKWFISYKLFLLF